MRWVEESVRDRHPDLLNFPNKVWVTLTKHNISGKITHWARRIFARVIDSTRGIKQYLQDSRLNFRRMDQRQVKVFEAFFSGKHSLGSDDEISLMAGKGQAKHVKDLADRLLEAMDSGDLKAQLQTLRDKADERMSLEVEQAEQRDKKYKERTAFENARVIAADRRYALKHDHWTDDWFVHDMVHGVESQTKGVASRFREMMGDNNESISFKERDSLLKTALENTCAELDEYSEKLNKQQQEREEEAAKGTTAISPDRYNQVISLGVDKARDYLRACIESDEERARFAATYHLALNLPATIRGRPVDRGLLHRAYKDRVVREQEQLDVQAQSVYSDGNAQAGDIKPAKRRKVVKEDPEDGAAYSASLNQQPAASGDKTRRRKKKHVVEDSQAPDGSSAVRRGRRPSLPGPGSPSSDV